MKPKLEANNEQRPTDVASGAVLGDVYCQHGLHLIIREPDWQRVRQSTVPKMRAGAQQVEMLVRHLNGDEEWQPLNINYGRQKLVDCYHPQVAESSASGGKFSRKAKSPNVPGEPSGVKQPITTE